MTRVNGQALVNDRPTSAYLLNAHGDGAAHYLSRRKDERFYGLGEKAGDLQRNGKRYEMRNLDAMGYNAVSTDPLYKHIPFTIARRDDVSYGVFYDNLSSCWLDLGNEIDNYHTAYRRWQAKRVILITTFLPANACWTSPKPSCA